MNLVLQGKKVSISHGLAETLDQMSRETDEFKAEVETFIYNLVSHLVVDDGKLVVAHAGMRQDMQGRTSNTAALIGLMGRGALGWDGLLADTRHGAAQARLPQFSAGAA